MTSPGSTPLGGVFVVEKSSQSTCLMALSFLAATWFTGCATAPPAIVAAHGSTPGVTTERVDDPVSDVSRSRFLMGTACDIIVAPTHAEKVDAAFDEIARVEQMISTWRTDSELSQLNRDQSPRAVSPELYDVLRRATEIARRTDGAFNPLVAPLLEIWQTRSDGRVPERKEISSALERLRLDNVTFSEPNTIALSRHAEFEEGGFAKGYALDRAIDLLRASGVDAATLNFGGQIASYGRAGEVAIAHPVSRAAEALRLNLRDASLSTSAGSERTFVVDGRTFAHIFDPRNGEALPPRGSVSVIARDAFQADALSTALYVMGPDVGLQWANAHDVAALFLIPEKNRFVVRTSKTFHDASVDLVAVHPHVSIVKGNITQ